LKKSALKVFKFRLNNLDWNRAIILLISIGLSVLSCIIDGDIIYRLPFVFSSMLCLILFYYGKKIWIYVFSAVLLLKVLYVLYPFYIIFSFQLFIINFNGLALILLVIHLNLNEILIKDLLGNSDKARKDNFQSRVERFEFKYRYKSKKQLNEVVDNKDVMAKEAIQAASNLIDKFDRR